MIATRKLVLAYGASTPLDLTIPTGAYAVLQGRTGVGKTTLLETIAGLKRAASGRVLLADRDATQLPPAERRVGYVPQDVALFRRMSVRENLAFGLKVRREPADALNEKVQSLAKLLEVEKLLDRDTHGLSGGERQRVALGRAMAVEPPILLLDEPFAALDDATRKSMQQLLKTVLAEMPTTVLHVSHQSQDAAALASVLLRMDERGITEIG